MGDRIIRSLCGICHTNCGIRVHLRDGKVTRVEGDLDHPVNKGYLCPKSAGIKPILGSKDRPGAEKLL